MALSRVTWGKWFGIMQNGELASVRGMRGISNRASVHENRGLGEGEGTKWSEGWVVCRKWGTALCHHYIFYYHPESSIAHCPHSRPHKRTRFLPIPSHSILLQRPATAVPSRMSTPQSQRFCAIARVLLVIIRYIVYCKLAWFFFAASPCDLSGVLTNPAVVSNE